MYKLQVLNGMSGWHIAHFKSGYSRTGTIELWQDCACDVCGKNELVLGVDSSEYEYGMGTICLPCIQKAFDPDNRERAR